MLRLSVIILTFNNIESTRQCLESLTRAIEHDDEVEIIVIDNASTDGTPQFIQEQYPDIKLTVNPVNRGVAPARNQGIAQASAPKILLLDNDTVVNRHAIQGLVDYMDTHPQVGLCTCSLTDAGGNVQRSFRPFPGVQGKILSLFGLRSAAEKFHFDEEGALEPFYVIGACQMIRREAMDAVGLLDEAIFYGPEDADFCIRLREAGWGVKYLPQFSIIHAYQRRTSHNPFSRLGIKHIKGLFYLYGKYHRFS